LPLHPRRLKATAGARNPMGASPWTNMTVTGSRDCFTITRQALQRALVEVVAGAPRLAQFDDALDESALRRSTAESKL
jgi:hypothetical protein